MRNALNWYRVDSDHLSFSKPNSPGILIRQPGLGLRCRPSLEGNPDFIAKGDGDFYRFDIKLDTRKMLVSPSGHRKVRHWDTEKVDHNQALEDHSDFRLVSLVLAGWQIEVDSTIEKLFE